MLKRDWGGLNYNGSVMFGLVLALCLLLVVPCFSIIMKTTNAETPSYDLDVPLSSGAHIYVTYDNTTTEGYIGWSSNQKAAVSNYISTYFPIMANQFWMIYKDCYFSIRAHDRMAGQLNESGINYDAQHNIVSYYAKLDLGMNEPFSTRQDATHWDSLFIMLHETIHAFQGWVPNYFDICDVYDESVANALPVIIANHCITWQTEQGQLLLPDSGEANYLMATLRGGYNIQGGWIKLWELDNNIFKNFNAWCASLPSGTNATFEDGVRAVLKHDLPNVAVIDGLPVDQWLKAYSICTLQDFPEGQKVLYYSLTRWLPGTGYAGDDGQPSINFVGVPMKVLEGAPKRPILPAYEWVAFVYAQSFDVTISDAQTHEVLYSQTGLPPGSATGQVVSFQHDIPFRPVVQINVTIHFNGTTDLPFTSYLTGDMRNYTAYNCNDQQFTHTQMIFLNRDGYAEGNGTANVGSVSQGLLDWTDSSVRDLEAKVTWSNGTYVYSVPNTLTSLEAMPHQYAVPLYQSRVWLSPTNQTTPSNIFPTLNTQMSPKVSTGQITLYQSINQVNWTACGSMTPVNGSASFSQVSYNSSLTQNSTVYFKTAWSGDGTIDGGESSPVSVTVTASVPTPTPTPAPTPTPITPTPTASPTQTSTTTSLPSATESPPVPEFPAPTILLLLTAAVLTLAVGYKRKKLTNR